MAYVFASMVSLLVSFRAACIRLEYEMADTKGGHEAQNNNVPHRFLKYWPQRCQVSGGFF